MQVPKQNTFLVSNSANLRLCCFVTCIGVKIKGVTEEHIVKKVLYKNFDMGKRSRWFDEYGQEPNVKVLARIIADLRVRYPVTTLVSKKILILYFVRDSKGCHNGHLNCLHIIV